MKKLYTVFTMVALMLIMPMNASAATHYAPSEAGIEYSSAPEGTAYMDILVQMTTDDESYVDFTQPPLRADGSEMPITADSGIALYNEGGYVSLSLHHKSAKTLTAGSGGDLIMSTSCDFIDLSQKYGDFKAAYVDENGSVLGVTEPSQTRYSTKTSYGFRAEGSSLIFQRHGAHPAVIAIIFAVFALTLISLPLVVTFIYRKRTSRIKSPKKTEKPRQGRR